MTVATNESDLRPLGLRARLAADLATAGCSPLHRFGQNFMVDPQALDRLVAELAAPPGGRVVEIGPGTGHLTERLLRLGCEVTAVEIDRGLAAHLEATLVPLGLRLHLGDCLDGKDGLHPAILAAALAPWRLCANLPYDVAIPAVLNAMALAPPHQAPERLVVTVQLEAAVRLVSRPGDQAWGASAAVLQASARPRIACKLGPRSFQPAPRVDSAILVADRVRALPAGFGAWVRRVFAYRRKVLPGALRDAGTPRPRGEAACAAAGIDASRRLETLDPDELLALYGLLA